jgi:hypothetical protein
MSDGFVVHSTSLSEIRTTLQSCVLKAMLVMSEHPLNKHSGTSKRQTRPRASVRLMAALNAPEKRPTALGSDSAWALRMKDAVDSAERELHVEVITAKPVLTHEPSRPTEMLFELDTNRGRVQAISSRVGTHQFNWL